MGFARVGRGVALAIVFAVAGSCVSRIDRKVGATLQTVDMKAPFLKVHMKNGDLFVLENWTIDEANQSLVGSGEQVGADRTTIAKQSFRIRFADVALYETNTVITSPGVAALAVITGISLAVTAYCLSDTKACFGSCPTFYAPGADGKPILQAEGFSDSIAPSLERHDIDALWSTTGRPGPLVVKMTNEAYETHVVKQVDLIAVPRPAGGRVLVSGEREAVRSGRGVDGVQFLLASRVDAPRACKGSEGDCLAQVRAIDDGRERTSKTDANDLATREVIDLELEATTDRTAVVIGARQSLVTTFLLYQGLAYLGRTATAWLARLSAAGAAGNARSLESLLGGIEVQIQRDGAWVTVEEVYETGPLARDVHVVELPPHTGGRVRLRMPQGSWRIDYIASAAVTGEAKPQRLSPVRIEGNTNPEFAGRAPATAFPIVTQPGDIYDFEYRLPPGAEYELFLDSRGYYLEWMREEWMREEQPLAALKMLLDPAQALRDLAPAFKQIEPHAEAVFWSSRYARP